MSSYQIPTIYTDELGLLDETCTSHGNNCPYMDMYTWITVTDNNYIPYSCLLYTSPSPRDKRQSRMPSSA